MKRILFAAMLLLWAVAAFPQIVGKVTDKQQRPVPYTTVLIYAGEITGGSPKAYAITDNDGKFRMNVEVTKGNWVVVRCVGFKELRQELDPAKHSYAFVLEEDVKSLTEVKVKGKFFGVSVDGDTVKFNTDYFKDGTEETAGEVLNKIPDMEVSENGDVSYAGKQVDKVLLDGKDIFSSGSGDVLLNNLPADAVESAEILMNYKGSSLVEEFRDRNQTALNIKTNRKGTTSGKLRLSAGITRAYEARGSLLHRRDNWTVSAMLSANNLDKPVFSLMDYLENFLELDNSLSEGNMGLSGGGSLLSLAFPASNMYQSDKGLFSVNATYYPSEKFKVKSRFTGNASMMKYENLSRQIYTGSQAYNLHSNARETGSGMLNGSVSLFYQPDKRWEFSSLTQGSFTGSLSDYRQNDRGLVKNLNVFTNDSTHDFNFGQELLSNAKVGKGLVSPHISLRLTDHTVRQQWWTDTAILPVDYTLHGDSLGLYIGTRKQQLSIKSDVNYARPLTSRIKLNANAAWEHVRKDFHYEELYHFMEEEIYSAGLSLNKRDGLFQYSLKMKAVADYWQTDVQEMENGFTPYLSASANVQFMFKPTHFLSLFASNGKSPIDFALLLRDTIITSYSNLYGGSHITDPFSEKYSLNMHYYLNNQFYGSSVTVFASYISSQSLAMASSYQEGLLGISSYDNKGEYSFLSFGTNFSQELGFIPVLLRLSGDYAQSNQDGKVNGTAMRLLSDSYSCGLTLASHSKSRFNGELGGKVSFSDSKYEGVSLDNRSWQWSGKAKCSYAHDHWKGYVYCGYSMMQTLLYGGERDLWDLGFSVTYSFKHVEIWLQGINLLNLNRNEWEQISMNAIYTSTTVFRKIPGSLLLGAAFKF